MKINKYLIEHYEKAFDGLEEKEALAIVNSLETSAKNLVFSLYLKGELEKWNIGVIKSNTFY